MNLNHRWLGTSVVRVRVLAAGLMLLAAGCAVLGWGSRSRQTAANTAAPLPGISISAYGIPANDGSGTVVSGLVAPGAASHPTQEVQSRARSLFAGLPLIFEPNQGQGNLDASDARAKFVAHGSGYSLFLGSEGAILSLVSRSKPSSGRDLGRQRAQVVMAARRRIPH